MARRAIPGRGHPKCCGWAPTIAMESAPRVTLADAHLETTIASMASDAEILAVQFRTAIVLERSGRKFDERSPRVHPWRAGGGPGHVPIKPRPPRHLAVRKASRIALTSAVQTSELLRPGLDACRRSRKKSPPAQICRRGRTRAAADGLKKCSALSVQDDQSDLAPAAQWGLCHNDLVWDGADLR